MKTIKEKLQTCAEIGVGIIFYFLLSPIFIIRNFNFYLRSPSIFVYALLTFILDRITKLLILASIHTLPYIVIQDFLTITFVKNYGVAFGWFQDLKLPPIIMAIVMVLIIAYYSFHLPMQEKLTRYSLALLVGGALGNLYDRLVYGYVVDFIAFKIFGYDFPVFNIADVAIDLGVALLFIDLFIVNPNNNPECNNIDANSCKHADIKNNTSENSNDLAMVI